MTLKQFVINASLKNLYYIVQSRIRRALRPLPDEKILAKAAGHQKCLMSGECQRCGCDIHSVLASDKECPDLLKGDIVAVQTDLGWTIETYDPEKKVFYLFKNIVVLNRIKYEDQN